ncbi:MAG: thermonuclease family protein [archaeon]
MGKKSKQVFLLIFLIGLLVLINYNFIDDWLEKSLLAYEIGVVERVIDGDTVVINNESVRLLGINSPEKGEKYYNEAKVFLEEVVLGEEVRLEFGKDRYDQYDRLLAYVYINRKNVNLELVLNGFANYYFLGKDKHYEDFVDAWKNCVDNLCKKSVDRCASCIELKEFDYENEIVIFYNKCDFDCELGGWEIKDEGRKKFVFPEFTLKQNKEITIEVGKGENSEGKLYWERDDYVWTDTGDTLFLRDREGGLVLWENY